MVNYIKSAVITGASKGIGKSIAEHLASKGFNILLISRSGKLLENISKDLKDKYSNLIVEYTENDINNIRELTPVINDFNEKCNGIGLLVNNAGYVKRGTSTLKEEELLKMVNSNLIGSINIVNFILPLMLKNKTGYIINMSSRNAKTPRPFLGGYAATKAGILAFNESLYKELKNTGIKVTALCPGFVDTQMTSEVKEDRSKLIQKNDICLTIDFLLSTSPSVAIKEICLESIVQVGEYC